MIISKFSFLQFFGLSFLEKNYRFYYILAEKYVGVKLVFNCNAVWPMCSQLWFAFSAVILCATPIHHHHHLTLIHPLPPHSPEITLATLRVSKWEGGCCVPSPPMIIVWEEEVVDFKMGEQIMTRQLTI